MLGDEKSPFWKSVLDTLTDGLMLVAPDTTILFVNSAMESITGYAAEEMLGKPCSVLDCDVCPDVGASGRREGCGLFRVGDLPKTRCALRRKDGTYLPILKRSRILHDDRGEVSCAVETITDMTAVDQKDEEITQLRSMLEDRAGFYGIIGVSPQMKNLYDIIAKAAGSDAPVLIYGESGTGKELVASVIHRLGMKSAGPFIRVNCAALSETLLESELFGHVKGAFTGADRTTKGRFQAANSGDIFLDEIGDLPPPTQVRLLRVLQEKEIERVGDYRPVPIDVRVIAATHRDLRQMMAQGLFREDLFFRLNVIPISIPPLRERPGDLPLLIEKFIGDAASRSGKTVRGIDHEGMRLLARYHWPGNVRELINVLEYAFVVCTGDLITRAHLPESILDRPPPLTAFHEKPIGRTEKQHLIDTLVRAGGKRKIAAEMLGVSRQTVWNRIKKYGIDVAELLGE